MSVTDPGYPIAWNADGCCDKCGAFVGWSDKSPPGVTYDSHGIHVCNDSTPRLIINYERKVKKLNRTPSPYRTFAPLGRREVRLDAVKRPPLPPQTDKEKLVARRNTLIQMGEQGRLTESLRLELEYLIDHLEEE